MSEGLPSATPEKGGDKKTAANVANNQGENNPIREIARPKRKTPKKFLGLSESKRRELLAIVMLVPWVWVDLNDAHTFGRLCLLASSLAVAQYVVFSFFKVGLKGWTLPIWVVSLLPICFVVWENSKPEEKPQLLVGFSTSHNLTNFLELKYETFNMTNGHPVAVVVPISMEETNVGFVIQIEGMSSIPVESAEVFLCLPKGAIYRVEGGWTKKFTPGVSMNTWVWQSSKTLFIGDSDNPPPFWVSSLQPIIDPGWGSLQPVEIFVRAKNMDMFKYSFFLSLWPVPEEMRNPDPPIQIVPMSERVVISNNITANKMLALPIKVPNVSNGSPFLVFSTNLSQ